MVKVRMNTADVAAEVRCLKTLIGMRCANVYDLSPKIYVIKLAKSSGMAASGESEKALLLLESGVRLHTTQFSRDKNMTPSGFTLKLRKHIRTRRLENVQQLGMDRVVDFQFGMGESAHHIILELYSQGNLLLTDADYNVLTLLRSHRDDEKGIVMMARHQYPVHTCRTFQRTTAQKLEAVLCCNKSVDGSQDQHNRDTVQEDEAVSRVCDSKAANNEGIRLMKMNKSKLVAPEKCGHQSKKDIVSLKSVLAESLGYGPALTEHVILDAGLQPNTDLNMADTRNIKSQLEALMLALEKFESWLENILNCADSSKGYIFMQKKNAGKKQSSISTETEHQAKIYDEFSPLHLNQFNEREHMVFESFDAAMDEFFSKIESQRAEQQRRAQEESAFSKLDKIRADQRSRVEALRQEVDQSVHMAELIEYNLEDVDSAILAVRTALASGMDWKDLGRMIKEERKAGNPVAGLIHSLQLEKNQITLLLSNNLDDMDDEEKTQPVNKVEVDLALSAHANARRWFDMKKKQVMKQEKTLAAHEKAFKAAERKTQQQLTQAKTIASISHLRKVHWFEKFNWFITSENYMVISGRDAQQNELIVKRYLKKGDLYVHADLHGAASTIIKNHDADQPIPPLTINQAGCFTVCRSQAWDSKIVTSAWWVFANQVSKTAPTGEYLTVGSFMIRGKKNFLPPYPLVMGFGILFRLDESCIAAHYNERRVKTDENNMVAIDEDEVMEEEKESSDDVTSMPREEDGDAIVENGESDQKPLELDDLVDRLLEVRPVSKYGLDIEVSEINEEEAKESVSNEIQADASKVQGKQKPHLSAAERRRIKRLGRLAASASLASEQYSEEPIGSEGETVAEEKTSVNLTKAEDAGLSKVMRGKRGKLKKIKEKYAGQDEEERKLRMSLLASAGKEANNVLDTEPTKLKMDKGKECSILEGVIAKVCYKCKKPGHIAADCLHGIIADNNQAPQNETNQEKLVPKGPSRRARAKEAQMEIAAILAEENIQDLDEDEKGKLTELDSLTGNPLPSDILLYAVPVCGPYSALQNYKYHVKLTPGAAKKGKAAKTAIDVFCHLQELQPREKDLIKATTDPELFACMIGSVKVTAPGLTKMKQSQKKGKKVLAQSK